MTYTVVLLHEREGGFSVSVPALQGCLTQGDTVEEALEMAAEAITLFLEVLVEDGDTIPGDVEAFTVETEDAVGMSVHRVWVPEAELVA
jgi:antitoxin HicB